MIPLIAIPLRRSALSQVEPLRVSPLRASIAIAQATIGAGHQDTARSTRSRASLTGRGEERRGEEDLKLIICSGKFLLNVKTRFVAFLFLKFLAASIFQLTPVGTFLCKAMPGDAGCLRQPCKFPPTDVRFIQLAMPTRAGERGGGQRVRQNHNRFSLSHLDFFQFPKKRVF